MGANFSEILQDLLYLRRQKDKFEHIFYPEYIKPPQIKAVLGARRGYISERDQYCALRNLLVVKDLYSCVRESLHPYKYSIADLQSQSLVVKSPEDVKKIRSAINSDSAVICGGPETNPLIDYILNKIDSPVRVTLLKKINLEVDGDNYTIPAGKPLSSDDFEAIAKAKAKKQYRYPHDTPYAIAEFDETGNLKEVLGSFELYEKPACLKINEKIIREDKPPIRKVTAMLVIHENSLIIAGTKGAATSSVVLHPYFIEKLDLEACKDLARTELNRAIIVLEILFKERPEMINYSELSKYPFNIPENMDKPRWDYGIQKPEHIEKIKIKRIYEF